MAPIVAALLLIAAGVPGPLLTQAKKSETAPLPIPRSVDELRAEIQKVVDSTKVPGVGFAVFTKDSLLYAGGVGFADVVAKRLIDADTHFRTGSISKSFVATALLMLQRAGRIDVNAPLQQLAPEIAIENRWEKSDPVRVVHLLEHTAGFDDMRFRSMYNLRDSARLPMRAVLTRAENSLHSRWRPGERFSYSNPGYGVAGYLIEKVSGMPYDRFIQDSILTPLGMTTSAFTIEGGARPLMAQGYHNVSDPPVGYPNIYLRPAGDLHSSPRELARFAQMLMRRGEVSGRQLLDTASIARMERTGSTLAAARGLSGGYGLGNYATLRLPVWMQGHDGGIDGFLSSYVYSVATNVGAIVLVNSDASGEAVDKVQRLLVVYALGDSTRRNPPEVAVPAAKLNIYTGYYADVAPRNQLFALLNRLLGGTTVLTRGDSLFARSVGDSAIRLVAVDDSTFRRPNEVGPTVGFYHDRDGALVLTGARYMRRASPWPPRLVIAGLITAAIVLASAILVALVWVPRAMLGKARNAAANRLRTTVLVAVLAIAAFVVLGVTADVSTLGVVSARTVAIFVFSVLVPALALIALGASARAPKLVVGGAVKVHSLLISLAALGFALLLITFGLAGLRTWVY